MRLLLVSLLIYTNCYSMCNILQEDSSEYYIKRSALLNYVQKEYNIPLKVSLQWQTWKDLPEYLQKKIISYYLLLKIFNYARSYKKNPISSFLWILHFITGDTNITSDFKAIPRLQSRCHNYIEKLGGLKNIYQLCLLLPAEINTFILPTPAKLITELYAKTYQDDLSFNFLHSGNVSTCALVDDTFLITGNQNGEIICHDLVKGTSELRRHRNHPITSLVANKDYVVYTMPYWDNSYWMVVEKLKNKEWSCTYSAIKNPNISLHNHLLLYNSNNFIYIVNLEKNGEYNLLDFEEFPSDNPLFYFNSQELLVFFKYKFTLLDMDIAALKPQYYMAYHNVPLKVTMATFNKDFIVMGNSNRLQIWNKKEKAPITSLNLNKLNFCEAHFMNNNSLLLAGPSGVHMYKPQFNREEKEKNSTVAEKLALVLWQ